MARKDNSDNASAVASEVTEADKARARQWFTKAADCRERREYDYAIECYINGLGYWPEAVEEGHMPLRSLAIQRLQAGGKKPGLRDSLKRSMVGKDPKKSMFNAEHLLSMEPQNAGYAEGVLKNASKAGYLKTLQWVAPIVFDTLRKDKKPNKNRFKAFREVLIEASAKAADAGDTVAETWFLEQAVNSIEYLIARTPTDEDLRNEQRDLAGKLTIARGKYEEAEDFRDSLRDADKQKLLHDADRVRQGEQTLDALIAAARQDCEANPTVAAKINALVEALLKSNAGVHQDEAIRVLTEAYDRLSNYSFKSRADDIRLRRLTSAARAIVGKAKESGTPEDRQQARLATMELRQVTIDVYRERVAEYPTDLRLKFKLGAALFDVGEYDEAIPLLQAAQADPRSRAHCQLLIGRSFFEKDNWTQATEVLREAIDGYELTDEFSRQLLYWLARGYEANGDTEEAKTAYGKLLRQDYNFMNGDARKRLESLK